VSDNSDLPFMGVLGRTNSHVTSVENFIWLLSTISLPHQAILSKVYLTHPITSISLPWAYLQVGPRTFNHQNNAQVTLEVEDSRYGNLSFLHVVRPDCTSTYGIEFYLDCQVPKWGQSRSGCTQNASDGM
jgi:hypothetical protein